MAQPEGCSSTAGGRLNGSIGTAVVAGDIVLGAGWGGSTHVVTTGSTVTRGEVVITGVTGGGLAQATATLVFTYPQGAFSAKPWFFVESRDSTLAASDWTVTQAATTTTALTITHETLPVNARTYTVRWICVA